MKTLKELEHELSIDWQSLQLMDPALERIHALKAYAVKFAIYKKERSWQIVMLDVAVAKIL